MKDLKLKTFDFLNELNIISLKILKIGNMLSKFVKNFLIYKIASEIHIEDNIYQTEIKKFYLENNIINKNDLEKILKIKAISKEELHYQITLPLKILKFANQNFQKELETFFLERKDFLDEYTFNIIRVKKKELAYELYFKLDSEESDFKNLSESFSYYSEFYPKGIFGPKNLQGVNPIITKKLIIALPGELIEPFQVDEWWIILKLIKKKNAKLDKPTSKMLLLEIFNKFINNLAENFTEDYFNTKK